MSNPRITALEARVADLEKALEVQAITVGRLLELDAEDRREWLTQWSRNRRGQLIVSPAIKCFMDGLLYGSSVNLPARLEELRLPT